MILRRPLVALAAGGLLLTACATHNDTGSRRASGVSAAPTTSETSPSVASGTPTAATVATARTGSGGGGATTSGPCRSAPRPAHWDHVVWIWLENHAPRALGSMPYLTSVARACGLTTNYRAVTHPSLPNYLAAVSGSTGGVTTDCGPRSCPQRRATLFQQVRSAGAQWRAYEEAMPRNCAMSATSSYAPKHNPPVYFPAIASDCARWDVPLAPALSNDIAGTRLPRFAFVTPDICNDGHDCSVTVTDNWLRTWLPRILHGPDYRAGRTLVVVTWDEDDHTAGNQVATVVIAPTVRPGSRVGTAFTHYSLLRTTEEMLRLPLLGAARSATSMRAAFGL